MTWMWPLPLRNARSSGRVSCPGEGLFNNLLRTPLTSQLDGVADFSVLMMVEDRVAVKLGCALPEVLFPSHGECPLISNSLCGRP